MSASNAFETSLLQLILQNSALAGIGDAGGLQPSAAAGSLYIGLHTADPGEAGDQTTSEATYTSYARVAVARSAAGFTVAGNNGSNTGAVTFPAATGGTDAITHFSVGTDAAGAGNLLLSGALTATLNVSTGIAPNFNAGELDINAD